MKRLIGALERYDRHVPLVERDIELDGLILRNLEVGQNQQLPHGRRRHQRMLRDQEFDFAEVSLASFLTARSQGLVDELVGLPIFPRRLFSVSQLYKPRGSELTGPGELAGRRVGIRGYQITLAVLLKGDLMRDHDVDWRDVTWWTEIPDVIPLDLPAGIAVEPLPDGMRVDEAARSGLVDTFAVPHPPDSVFADPQEPEFVRLLEDPRAADHRYVQRWGYWPIMHLIAIKRDWVDRFPALVAELMTLFEDGRRYAATLAHDPNGTIHPWGQLSAQEEVGRLGEDRWVDGFAANVANLEHFVGYCSDQGLLARPLAWSEVFHPSTLDT